MLHLSLAFTTPSIGFVKSSSHVAACSEESLVFSTTRGKNQQLSSCHLYCKQLCLILTPPIEAIGTNLVIRPRFSTIQSSFPTTWKTAPSILPMLTWTQCHLYPILAFRKCNCRVFLAVASSFHNTWQHNLTPSISPKRHYHTENSLYKRCFKILKPPLLMVV